MKFLDLIASPIWSTVTGGVGALLTGVLSLINRRMDAKENAEKRAHEIALTQLVGNLDQAKLAAGIAQLREAGAAEAFTESIRNDASSHRGARWVQSLRESTRPLLTWLYQFAFVLLTALLVVSWWKKWCNEYQVLPLIEYCVMAIVNCASLTLSWWFGQRQIEKVSLSWGNRSFGASVSSQQQPQPIKK